MVPEAPVPGDAPPPFRIDPLLPQEMAAKCERVGAEKARLDTVSLLALAVLAGAFVAFGALFATTVAAGGGDLPYGVVRLLSGLVFSVGLILVVVGGAELFTGNNLMVMAWASGRAGTREILRAWSLVYLGNLIGSVATAILVFLAGHHLFADGAVGAAALGLAQAKGALPLARAFFLGVLCNVLVCLAVWLSYSGRTVADKILAIAPTIAAFVAAGFEHSVANMYLFAVGLLIKRGAPAAFWDAVGAAPAAYPDLTLAAAAANLATVTLGNVIGGGVLVGGVYWFIYLRRR